MKDRRTRAELAEAPASEATARAAILRGAIIAIHGKAKADEIDPEQQAFQS